MIILILLQIFQVQLDSTRSLINKLYHEEAYQLVRKIETELLSELKKCEVLELKGLTAINDRQFTEAERVYREVFKCKDDRILRKAFTNYADLQYKQFNFKSRLFYLQKAFNIEQTNQLIRIIAKHHFQIEADYDLAESWLKRHTIPKNAKDSSGYFSTLAQLAEAKRQYDQAIHHYTQAKISASRANLFNYELFAAEGEYRAERLAEEVYMEKINNWLYYVIFIVVFYIMTRNSEKIRAYVTRKPYRS